MTDCWLCGQRKNRGATRREEQYHTGITCSHCKHPTDPMTQLRHCLAQRTIEDIRESIQAFDEIDIRNLDDKQLAIALRKVLMNQVDGQRSILVLPYSTSEHKVGSVFSRVRRLSATDLRRAQREGIDEQRDCYEPPVDMTSAIGPGRLNRPGERILYTAYGGAGWATMACFEELEIQEDDWVHDHRV